MVEMTKTHGLNIYGYLKFLLEHRPDKDMTDEQLVELDLRRKTLIYQKSHVNYSELLQLAKSWGNFKFYRGIIWRLLPDGHIPLQVELIP